MKLMLFHSRFQLGSNTQKSDEDQAQNWSAHLFYFMHVLMLHFHRMEADKMDSVLSN